MDSASNIRAIRSALGMSQAALAGALGMTQANVYHYEVRGQAVPPDVAKRLIEVASDRGLKISYDHVYGAVPLPELITADGAPKVPEAAREVAP